MPNVCAACGAPSDQLVAYTQDNAPIVLPGIGVIRTMPVAVPYCVAHAADFRRRFKRLRWAQFMGYIVALAAGLAVAPRVNLFSFAPQLRIAAFVVLAVSFVFLVISLFVIKPLQYDVYFSTDGNRLKVRGNFAFLERVIESNRDNVHGSS
jgi:hypothetical protein